MTTTILGHWINGTPAADNNRPAPVTNPATGEVKLKVAMASKATVESAIAAAQAAFPAWRDTPPLKRARVMFNTLRRCWKSTPTALSKPLPLSTARCGTTR